jgi:aspartyl-tRNA(Asn)/glutamyl-tRNA(Gln) amidotransferase subunit A
MASFPRLTLRKVIRMLDRGMITSEDMCRYCYTLAYLGEVDFSLNAFTKLIEKEITFEKARESDKRRKEGKTLSILDGIPFTVKSNIAVADRPLTAGSRILGEGNRHTPPVGYDAEVIRRLLDSGAILMGTTSMDEFGMGSLGMHGVRRRADEGPYAVKNPRPLLADPPIWSDLKVAEVIKVPLWLMAEAFNASEESRMQFYSAGGSSCGSAASVAYGSSLFSIGSDTGGSVRLPASWCGVVGLKPTYGLLPRHGLVSYASSLDTIGIIAPTVNCAATVLHCLMLQEENHANDNTIVDSTHSKPTQEHINWMGKVTEITGTLTAYLQGVKVGIPSAFSVAECPQPVLDAWSKAAECLQRYGATIVEVDEISPEVLQKSLAAYYVLVCAEASSNLARYDGFRYGVATDPNSIQWKTKDDNFSVLERQYAVTRTEGFGKEVIRRVLCGTSVLSSDRFSKYYEAATKLRAVLTRQMRACLRTKKTGPGCDLLLTPTSVFEPPILADLTQEEQPKIDATEMIANDVMTVPISLAGLPAISVPVGEWNNGLPFRPGMQLVAARNKEGSLLLAARALEMADWPS